MSERPRVRVPKQARKGEIVEIKTLISHPMESGQRKNAAGQPIPRKIINRFSCEFNGSPVFACALETGIAANPFLQFSARVGESGTFRFTWLDDDGTIITHKEKIAVI